MPLTSLTRLFVRSAGVCLLAAALALGVGVWHGRGLTHPPDPVLFIAVPKVFGGLALLGTLTGLLCLLRPRTTGKPALLLWVALNLIVGQIGWRYAGASGGLQGYARDLTSAFGLPAASVNNLLAGFTFYLLAGSLFTLWWTRRQVQDLGTGTKISCPGCGTHLQFALQNLGQTIACPRCRAPVLLRRPGQLKMACYFCQGRIEFPSHALGQKMPCPHCQMDITLKEKAIA